jgi:hypothetical protein
LIQASDDTVTTSDLVRVQRQAGEAKRKKKGEDQEQRKRKAREKGKYLYGVRMISRTKSKNQTNILRIGFVRWRLQVIAGL